MVYKDTERNKAYHREYSKQWYRLQDVEQRRQYRRQQVREIRKKAIQALGGACIQCGYTDVRALEIDHVIPLRSHTPRFNQVSFFLAIIRGETDNLQLLCANCHAIKTYEEARIE